MAEMNDQPEAGPEAADAGLSQQEDKQPGSIDSGALVRSGSPQYITTQPVYSLEEETAGPDTLRLAKVPHGALGILVENQEEPMIYKGSRQMTLGRHAPGDSPPTIDLTDFDATEKGVSRRHAMISMVEETFSIQDLGSTNGTWLNGNRLTPYRAYELTPGDRLRLGQLRLRVYFQAPQPGSAATQVLVLKSRKPSEGEQGSDQLLTPEYLLSEVGPYLSAISGIQQVINEILGDTEAEVLITSISRSPVTITLTGAAQAVNLIKLKVTPWEKAYASDLAAVWDRGTKATTEMEARRSRSFLFGRRRETTVEADPLSTRLERARLRLALEIIDLVKPDLSEEAKSEYAQRLLPHLKTLTLSGFSPYIV